jgi:hypothetical protein
MPLCCLGTLRLDSVDGGKIIVDEGPNEHASLTANLPPCRRGWPF